MNMAFIGIGILLWLGWVIAPLVLTILAYALGFIVLFIKAIFHKKP